MNISKLSVKPKFYVCVDYARDLDVGINIAQFLISLGIPTLPPTFKFIIGGCAIDNDKFKKMFDNDVVVVCVSRLYRTSSLKLVRKLSLFHKILHLIFPIKFYLGSLSKLKNGLYVIILHMPTIERVKASPLAVLIHELLHLGRIEDCENEWCLGCGHGYLFTMCENCSKLFNEIINRFCVDIYEVLLNADND